jgi:hypothetical protein
LNIFAKQELGRKKEVPKQELGNQDSNFTGLRDSEKTRLIREL